MSDLHQLQVSAADQAALEKVDAKFIADGLLKAREKTIEVLELARNEFKEGIDENEARILTLKVFADHGVTKHWHRPYIRFGEATVLTYNDPVSNQRFSKGEPYYLDLGPVWPSETLGMEAGLEYEGDYGDTFVFGENRDAEKMIAVAHEIFDLAKNEWHQKRLTGENIYQFLKEQSEKQGYTFLDQIDGHRVSDFPHHKYTRESLGKVKFVPSGSLWVLEAMICHPKLKMGAFYEDLMI